MRTFLALVCAALTLSAQAQGPQLYGATEGNIIFSLGMVEQSTGATPKKVLRYAPFWNAGHQLHFDFGRVAGIYTGLEVKNVGFILKDTILHKHRAYSAGILLGAKLGRIDKGIYFFAGGTYEYLFAYKEKLFYNSEKIKRKDFYVSDINQLQPALFAGLSLNGINFRVQYYLNNFFDKGYRFTTRNGFQYPSYKTSNVLLFMIGFKKNFPDPYKKAKKEIPKTYDL